MKSWKEAIGRNWRTLDEAGPPCQRCNRPTLAFRRDQISEYLQKQEHYYNQQYWCDHEDCETTWIRRHEDKVFLNRGGSGDAVMRTMEAARGRWSEILAAMGVPPSFLTKRNGPCPWCAGRDRFRFTDHNGDGWFKCSQCGGEKGGDGIGFLARFKGWDIPTAMRAVNEMLGNLPAPAQPWSPQQPPDPNAWRKLYAGSSALTPDDFSWRFLVDTRALVPPFPLALRSHPNLRYNHADGRVSWHPGMIAAYRDVDGRVVSIHKTYLTWDGRKADLGDEPVRKFMRGKLPPGGAIWLGEPAEVMGVAESIETALAARQKFGMPVWAASSAGSLRCWQPPAIARHVFVCGDNDGDKDKDKDAHGKGQEAAYALADRLRLTHEVTVKIPDMLPGRTKTDWNDVLMAERAQTLEHLLDAPVDA